MKEVKEDLSSGVHEIEKDDQTVKIQFVPQIVSTLRLDLVFWSQGNMFLKIKSSEPLKTSTFYIKIKLITRCSRLESSFLNSLRGKIFFFLKIFVKSPPLF